MSLFTKSNVLEISNRAAINNSTGSVDLLTNKINNHESGLNTSAHEVSNISGLQAALNSKQDIISGYTGNISVVVGVDFTAQAVITVEIKIVNGVITEIN